jgi:hypothetical protein
LDELLGFLLQPHAKAQVVSVKKRRRFSMAVSYASIRCGKGGIAT